MKNERLEEFMSKIRYVNDKICFYEGECKYPLTPAHLLVRVDKIEASTEKTNGVSEYDKLLFEKKVEKLDYKKITKKVLTPKNEITGNKKDQFTIVGDDQEAVEIWNVSNQVGIYSSFTNEKEANELYNKINEEVIKQL